MTQLQHLSLRNDPVRRREILSNQALVVCQKQVLDFGNFATGVSFQTILADRLELLQWREITAVLNVHTHSLGSGAGTISVVFYQQSWSEEDPGTPFLGSGAQTFTLNSSTPNPACLALALPMLGTTFALADMTQIRAFFSRSAAGPLNATISLRLFAKDA